MAHISYEICNTCNSTTQHVNNKCCECLVKENKKRIHEWKSLSIEDKLENINKRLKKLERGETRYS